MGNSSSATTGNGTMCVHVQNLAGAVLTFDVRADETVGNLRRLVHAAAPPLVECALSRLRVFVMPSAGDAVAQLASGIAPNQAALASSSDFDPASPVTLDDDARTLASYSVASGTTLHVVARAHEFGALVRVIGTQGSGDAQFCDPWSVCTSPEGELLYVAEYTGDRVQVVRASNGARVRTLDGSRGIARNIGEFTCVCLSHDGAHVLVTDGLNNSVHVLRAADGEQERTIGNHGSNEEQLLQPYSMCLSHDKQSVLALDSAYLRVLELRVSDGAYVRTIGPYAYGNSEPNHFDTPRGMCLSPDGELLYVVDSGNRRVQVLRTADGAHARTISAAHLEQFQDPHGVCVSHDGTLLFVTDCGAHCVHVVRATDGERVHTIGSPGAGAGQFNAPEGVCLSPDGDLLFVADTLNHRVQVFDV